MMQITRVVCIKIDSDVIRTLGIGFDETRGSWDYTPLHGQDCLDEARDTSCWLSMANIAFDLGKPQRDS